MSCAPPPRGSSLVTWVNPRAPCCPMPACRHIRRTDPSEVINTNLNLDYVSQRTLRGSNSNSQGHFFNQPLSHSFHSLSLSHPHRCFHGVVSSRCLSSSPSLMTCFCIRGLGWAEGKGHASTFLVGWGGRLYWFWSQCPRTFNTLL